MDKAAQNGWSLAYAPSNWSLLIALLPSQAGKLRGLNVDIFNDMNAQIAQFPTWLQYWLTWMQTMLILMPFVFIKRREAQTLIAAQVLNFALGFYVYAAQGYMITKLFGLGHIFWAVTFAYIIHRIATGKAETQGRPYFRAWLYAASVTLAISLMFDTYDLIQYAGGVREPMVEYYAR